MVTTAKCSCSTQSRCPEPAQSMNAKHRPVPSLPGSLTCKYPFLIIPHSLYKEVIPVCRIVLSPPTLKWMSTILDQPRPHSSDTICSPHSLHCSIIANQHLPAPTLLTRNSIVPYLFLLSLIFVNSIANLFFIKPPLTVNHLCHTHALNKKAYQF